MYHGLLVKATSVALMMAIYLYSNPQIKVFNQVLTAACFKLIAFCLLVCYLLPWCKSKAEDSYEFNGKSE